MITPADVKAKARILEDDNIAFRSFLRNHADDDELDAQFLRLHTELFADYDCCKCNNCCKEYKIIVKAEEADAIAHFLGKTSNDFITEYLIENDENDEGEYIINSSPCTFLDASGYCTIHEFKPVVCKGFPYTDKTERLMSMYSVIESAEVCPIVFEILERLKQIYRFRNRK